MVLDICLSTSPTSASVAAGSGDASVAALARTPYCAVSHRHLHRAADIRWGAGYATSGSDHSIGSLMRVNVGVDGAALKS